MNIQHRTFRVKGCNQTMASYRAAVKSRRPKTCLYATSDIKGPSNRAWNGHPTSGLHLHGYLQHCITAQGDHRANKSSVECFDTNLQNSDDGRHDDTAFSLQEEGIQTTEMEVEELRQTIQAICVAQQELQKEMDKVVGRLSDLLENVKTVQNSNKDATEISDHDHGVARSLGTATNNKSQRDTPQSNSVGDKHTIVSCVLQHPGALCCTRTTVHPSISDGTHTVTVKTTARLTEDANAISNEELGALAAQALMTGASDHLRGRVEDLRRRTFSNYDVNGRHKDICHALETGEIIKAERNPVISQFGHESFVMTLRDDTSGRQLKAIFKPRVQGDAGGWHNAPMEWVAYKLNILLGMDYVPPVGYRRGGVCFWEGGEGNEGPHSCDYAEGAMLYFIEESRPLRCFPEAQWGAPPVSKSILLSDTRILDVLLHNSDRHHGHFLLGRHWSKGEWVDGRWVGKRLPCLIDHAASFRADADVSMVHENAFQTGPVKCVSAKTYLNLRLLDYATLAHEFGAVLTDEQLRAMVKRRDKMLRYLDGLVADQGFASTVL